MRRCRSTISKSNSVERGEKSTLSNLAVSNPVVNDKIDEDIGNSAFEMKRMNNEEIAEDAEDSYGLYQR